MLRHRRRKYRTRSIIDTIVSPTPTHSFTFKWPGSSQAPQKDKKRQLCRDGHEEAMGKLASCGPQIPVLPFNLPAKHLKLTQKTQQWKCFVSMVALILKRSLLPEINAEIIYMSTLPLAAQGKNVLCMVNSLICLKQLCMLLTIA